MLKIPGYSEGEMKTFFYDFMEQTEVNLAAENVGMVIYNFTKNDQMNEDVWKKIEPSIYLHKG